MRDTPRKPRKKTEGPLPPAGIDKKKLKTPGGGTLRKPRVKTEGPAPPGGVRIFIDDAGRPFCEPYYAHVERGSKVRWNFEGPWAIEFTKGTPLKNGQLVVHGHGNEPPVTIDQDAQGHFPYSVMAVGEDARGTPTIFFDLACPEIIFP